MITGVETVGIILGALPLVIDALQHYDEGLKPLKDFVRYKSMIQELADDLDKQWTLLKFTCELLLVNLAVPEEDLPHLLDSPTSSIWRKADVTHQLASRLQDVYPKFFGTLNKIADKFYGLTERIGLDHHGNRQWTDKTRKRYWKRFTICLSRKEHESLIAQIAAETNYLHQLTKNSILLEPARSRRRNQKKAFKDIRDHAACLHSLLYSAWSCNCSAAHRAELRLESRDCNLSPCFRVTFPLDSTVSSASPAAWHETDIKVSPTAIDRRTGSLDTTVGTCFSESSNNLSTILKHPKNKRKSVTFAAITAGIRVANISLPDAKGSEGKSETKQDVRDIDNLCSILHSKEGQCADGTLGRFVDKENEYMVVSVSHHESADTDAPTLHDLLMQHGQGHPLSEATRSLFTPLVSSSKFRLTKKDRLQLAVTLASTSLQLYTTPWLDGDWTNKMISFRNGSIDCPYISCTFEQRAPAAAAQNPSPLEWSPIRNQNIFRLGVLLLETSLGRPLDAYMANEQSVPFGDYRLATELLKSLANEESENYVQALKTCIYCDFGNKAPELDFGNNLFRQAVYEDVIQPLEQELEMFCRRP
ncbi:MAG: hypothetical protein Q9170_007069 [Blastenia crenularia]